MEENKSTEKSLLKDTKKSRKNLWIFIFIVISLCALSAAYIIKNDIFGNEIPYGNNVSFEQYVCSQIRMTPTWINVLNNKIGIIDEGYTNFNNSNSKDAVDLLINAQVYLVYHSDCGPCQNQIGYFGTEWGRYVNSGYTINCKNVL